MKRRGRMSRSGRTRRANWSERKKIHWRRRRRKRGLKTFDDWEDKNGGILGKLGGKMERIGG
jgi:hypothetical protein